MIDIIKRDGSRQRFDDNRIVKAVASAMNDAGLRDDDFARSVSSTVRNHFEGKGTVDIYDLQSKVENVMMQSRYKDAARSYIEFRRTRDIERESRNVLNKEILGIINQDDEQLLNENANKDGKIIPTQRDLLAGVVARHYAKQHILPRHVTEAHDRGEIHYHDLDYSPFFPMFNCMLIDVEGMLKKGFKMGNAEIEEPRSILTATAITAQIIAQVSSHIYGGTSINEIDRIHAPYVRKTFEKHLEQGIRWIGDEEKAKAYAEERTEKDCFDAYQALEYEINTLHTANGQTPFVTFGFGLGTSWEERLVQKSILKNRIRGLGKNKKTPVFPKLVFAIRRGVNSNKEDPNYDIKQLALECATKRMYPDILNYDKLVEVTGSFKTPMGCRSFLGVYEENGELVHDGRNNLGVVSLNLPRIAIEAKGCEEEFYRILEKRLAVAKDALMTRIQRLDNVRASVAPILYVEGACGVRLKPEEKISEIFKNGRASISLGYIGVHETINALYSDGHIYESEQLQKKGIQLVKYLRNAVNGWKAETGYGFSLYSTPSESLCDRFCRLDKKEFGIIEGVTGKGYYTNSFHLDVEQKATPYDKVDFEMDYPMHASGGFICYGEFPNMQHNIKALESVWDYTYDRVPYYGTNTPIDICYKCDYEGEFLATARGFECPSCQNRDSTKMSVTRRVCGYLGQPNSRPFIKGKQEEVTRRVKHL
ncbi:anaerobic ribonucleoside-triphosphate reductase [Sansalvadorimonas sp. 2012CJ34-2]|uniref:Anaerobic ribonucleoside-triphosphate reductase n=1 Tax=Parendozoicomonas callyspongiae TaxID=2942213 RepID=A0ABT0PJ44_9GAMM|nr:anaerobic ribonucleoside-triphosphate reductase [Sansalvadorimonas sp. 2012CJ34-2]MCL6271404.1 anaerobic ribonucleoside-triphosphate reductase [Sansalvadorimonas sp. 2012CJ34-2]